jgi:lipoprotein-releasing system ATP-binding protein
VSRRRGGAGRARVVSVVEARGVTKEYRGGDGSLLRVLDGVALQVRRGEMVAVVGASGAGKSTLLHVLGALERPTRGEVWIGGEPLAGRTDEALAALRNRSVGFVFQFHHLLREFSALENVMMPQRILGVAEPEARSRALELLELVGLARGRTTGRRRCRAASSSGPRWRARSRRARRAARRRAVGQPRPRERRAAARPVRRRRARLGRHGLVVVTHNRSLASARTGCCACRRGGWCRRTWATARRGRAGWREARARVAFRQAGGRPPAGGDGGPAMLCENCKERDAVVNLTKIKEGAVTQLHLCEKCAAEQGVETTRGAAEAALTDFLQAVQQQAAAAPGDQAACHFCGATARDFRQTGRWGARGATARSSAACASCCGGCTATREAHGAPVRAAGARADRGGGARGPAPRAAAARDRGRAVRAGGGAARPAPRDRRSS